MTADQIEGQNQPNFQQMQLDFAAHIRDPENNPIPDDIEPRRMGIYVRLIYNNIESFCATRFARAKAILGEAAWHALIRDFTHRHQSSSPYFSQISEEFLSFLLLERDNPSDPEFLTELCHFEWLSLYLDRLNETISPFEICDRPLESTLVLSPLAIVRKYGWPVNQLSPDFQPNEIPKNPTWVIAYRDRADNVHIRITQPAMALLAERFRSPTQGHVVLNELLENSSKDTSQVEETLTNRLLELIDLDVLVVI